VDADDRVVIGVRTPVATDDVRVEEEEEEEGLACRGRPPTAVVATPAAADDGLESSASEACLEAMLDVDVEVDVDVVGRRLLT